MPQGQLMPLLNECRPRRNLSGLRAEFVLYFAVAEPAKALHNVVPCETMLHAPECWVN